MVPGALREPGYAGCAKRGHEPSWRPPRKTSRKLGGSNLCRECGLPSSSAVVANDAGGYCCDDGLGNVVHNLSDF